MGDMSQREGVERSSEVLKKGRTVKTPTGHQVSVHGPRAVVIARTLDHDRSGRPAPLMHVTTVESVRSGEAAKTFQKHAKAMGRHIANPASLHEEMVHGVTQAASKGFLGTGLFRKSLDGHDAFFGGQRCATD
jgi:hypothetical protein